MPDNAAYRREVLKHTREKQRHEIDYFLNTFDNAKATVILVPGGMGSQLYRANKIFWTPNRNYKFKEIWLDMGFIGFARDGLKLKIDRSGIDLKRRVVVAAEDTQFMFLRPYLKAMRFFRHCGGTGFNAVFLAWDWRRNLLTAADALNQLVACIKEKSECSRNPKDVMGNVFIVGHSMGGMVAKLFFERCQDLASEIGGMISVGTPFHGYFSQLHHVFEGQSLMNRFYDAKTVAKISSSLPGLLTLFPIDEDTWKRKGKSIGLSEYPVKDLDGKNADAYKDGAPFPRWLSTETLKSALEVHRCVSRDLPDGLKDKVHHIRGSNPLSTPVTAIWDQKKLPPGYDPKKHQSPVKDGTKGPGDETIPYWSAALCDTPVANIIDFNQAKHMKLMEQTFVLQSILEIVSRNTRSITEQEFIAEYGPEAQIATSDELNDFLDKVDLTEATTNEQLATLIPEKYAWRFLQDIWK